MTKLIDMKKYADERKALIEELTEDGAGFVRGGVVPEASSCCNSTFLCPPNYYCFIGQINCRPDVIGFCLAQ